MAAFSNYLETEIAEWFQGNAMPAAPSNWYVALFNGDPTDTGSGGTEITNTIRGTTTRSNIAAAGLTVSGNEVSNTAAHVVVASASAGATATHFGVFTAATAGNLLFHGALTASKTINAGDEVRFDAGQLSITID